MDPFYCEFIGEIALLFKAVDLILAIVFRFAVGVGILRVEEDVVLAVDVFPVHAQHEFTESISNFILESWLDGLLLLVESLIVVVVFLALLLEYFEVAAIELGVWSFFGWFPVAGREVLTGYVELDLDYL